MISPATWEAIVPLFPKMLITGERTSFWYPELLMRARADGKWTYRRPTAEEVAEYLSDRAW